MSSKRKRELSASSHNDTRSRLPSESINPLSHPPDLLRQFRLAGLAETEEPPSTYTKHFPHAPLRPPGFDKRRGPPHFTSASDFTDDDGDDDDDARSGECRSQPASDIDDARSVRSSGGRRRFNMTTRQRANLHKFQAQDRLLGPLINIVLRSLQEGNISRAKHAYGLICRSQLTADKIVDLRRHGLWGLGAEIMMRDGEDVAHQTLHGTGAPRSRRGRRWGVTENMPKLKAFLDGLILQHPWSRHHPESISAVDFWPILLQCEFYNIYIEHKLDLEDLEIDSIGWEDELEDDDDDVVGISGGVRLTYRERMVKQQKQIIVGQALERIQDTNKRMNTLMEAIPYSQSIELWRMRGMVALYMADLLLPVPPATAEEDEQRRDEHDNEMLRAKEAFRKTKERGGHIEKWMQKIIGVDESMAEDSDEDDLDLPTFSSLPMR